MLMVDVLWIGVDGQEERLKCYMQISKVYLVSMSRDVHSYTH